MLRAANLLLALGRDDLRAVRYSWEGRPPRDPVLLGGMTSVSSGTDAGDADMTTSLSRIFDFYVIYKLLAVDTEVDPPQRNSRSWIFETEGVRQSFLECLTLTAAAKGGRVHAWCLMSNHYHLLIQTPDANLVEGMK